MGREKSGGDRLEGVTSMVVVEGDIQGEHPRA